MMQKLKRVFRGIQHLFSWFFFEKPKGLDFSLRDLNHVKGGYNGYAATSWKAIKNIDQVLTLKNKAFLDIGSGKGFTVLNAYKLGARKSTGIEYNLHLHNIAQQNFTKLHLEKMISSVNEDALKFQEYAQYDVYFLFNPFEYHVYSKVIDRIFSQIDGTGKERHIICYGDANLECITVKPGAHLLYSGICPFRGNTINIFRIGMIDRKIKVKSARGKVNV
jgi:16S rRNA G966 N2-methylase RsmD